MEVHTKKWSEVMTMIRNGEIQDAKTAGGAVVRGELSEEGELLEALAMGYGLWLGR